MKYAERTQEEKTRSWNIVAVVTFALNARMFKGKNLRVLCVQMEDVNLTWRKCFCRKVSKRQQEQFLKTLIVQMKEKPTSVLGDKC